MTILDKLEAAAKKRVTEAKDKVSDDELKKAAFRMKNESPFLFEQALKSEELSFICEVKRASPSKGLIAEDFPYLEIAREYEEIGAGAVSVLTEPEYFKGSDQYLKEIAQAIKIPVLRKDFTVDTYQIYEAKTLGADAVLLICALLSEVQIKDYIEICDSLGLSAVVEAHDESEVTRALNAGARVIGVNNRDLKTFQVDINNCINLKTLVPPEITFVAESGIETPEDIRSLKNAGVDAVLIGETLMRSPDKEKTIQWLGGDIVD